MNKTLVFVFYCLMSTGLSVAFFMSRAEMAFGFFILSGVMRAATISYAWENS